MDKAHTAHSMNDNPDVTSQDAQAPRWGRVGLSIRSPHGPVSDVADTRIGAAFYRNARYWAQTSARAAASARYQSLADNSPRVRESSPVRIMRATPPEQGATRRRSRNRVQGDPVRSSPGTGVDISGGRLRWTLRYLGTGDRSPVMEGSDRAPTVRLPTNGHDVELRAEFIPSARGLPCRTPGFIQTVRAQVGGVPDPGHPHLLLTRDPASGYAVDAGAQDTEPYYTLAPRGQTPGLVVDPVRTQATSTPGQRALTFIDTPMIGRLTIPHNQVARREFELAVICAESGASFGSLRWGYTKTRDGVITLTGATQGDVRTASATPQFEAARLAFYRGQFDHSLDGFRRGSARLLPRHRSYLRGIVRLNLLDRVLLVGANDNSGGPEANAGLSLRRAEAARDFLVSQGFDANRIDVEGHGVAARVPNPPGRRVAANRRVDVRLVRGAARNGGIVGSPAEAFRLRAANPRDLLDEFSNTLDSLERQHPVDPALWRQLTHIRSAIDGWRRRGVAMPDLGRIYQQRLHAVRRRLPSDPPDPRAWQLPPRR